MKAAITTLEIALENLETNEPIHRKEGNVEQADAELRNAAEIRQALVLMDVATSGPFYDGVCKRKELPPMRFSE